MAILELEVFSLSVRDEEKNISYKILKPGHPNLLEQTAQETPFHGMYPAANIIKLFTNVIHKFS
jgi:hypothetical protein